MDPKKLAEEIAEALCEYGFDAMDYGVAAVEIERVILPLLIRAREEWVREKRTAADNARVLLSDSGEVFITIFGPGEPGKCGTATVTLELLPDDEGNFGAVGRWNGRFYSDDFVGIKTLSDLHGELTAILRAIRRAPVAHEEKRDAE